MVERARLSAEQKERGFKPGREKTGGRAPGTPNKTTRLLKEAIIMAAEAVGAADLKHTREYRKGLDAYLEFLARKHPQTFASLLRGLLPIQVTGKDGGPVQMNYTRQELVQRLREKGIPVPPSLATPPPGATHKGTTTAQ